MSLLKQQQRRRQRLSGSVAATETQRCWTKKHAEREGYMAGLVYLPGYLGHGDAAILSDRREDVGVDVDDQMGPMDCLTRKQRESRARWT